jgi:hypothetical protein
MRTNSSWEASEEDEEPEDDDLYLYLRFTIDEERYQEESIVLLKTLVRLYEGDLNCPLPLDGTPDGFLYGIAFVYDEDHDDRILLAINTLSSLIDFHIIAVAEHEGELNIYTEKPTGLKQLAVVNDVWYITEFVLENDNWVASLR